MYSLTDNKNCNKFILSTYNENRWRKGVGKRKENMELGEKRANRINSYHRFERSISFFLVACGEDEPTGPIKRANSFSIFFPQGFRCFAKCDYTGWLAEHDNIISTAIILRNRIWIYSGETAGLTRPSIEIKQGFRVPADPLSVRVRASCYTRARVHTVTTHPYISIHRYLSIYLYPSRKLANILIAFHRIPQEIPYKSVRRGSRELRCPLEQWFFVPLHAFEG